MKGDDIFWIIFLKVDTFTVKELAFKLIYIYINAAGLRIKLVDIVQRKGNLDLLYVCFLVTIEIVNVITLIDHIYFQNVDGCF